MGSPFPSPGSETRAAGLAAQNDLRTGVRLHRPSVDPVSAYISGSDSRSSRLVPEAGSNLAHVLSSPRAAGDGIRDQGVDRPGQAAMDMVPSCNATAHDRG